MTDPKEKQKTEIKTRQPKKVTPGIFDNLRMPQAHPVEEILGLVPPQPTPSPVEAPVITTVETPVETVVRTAVTTPVDTTVEKSESRPREDRTAQPQFLDATHTASEQRIYSVMYRETISKGVRERHYGPKELCEKTGIRSDKTIRVAVHGLIEKLSVEVVSHHAYHPLGPRYRVYEPREIVRRRRAAGIEIDPQTKKIITPVTTTVDTTVNSIVDAGGKNYSSTGEETTGVAPVEITGAISKYINSDLQPSDSLAPSSSKSQSEGADSDDDNAFLDSVRNVYERATGNAWTTSDAITAQKGRDIPAEIWGIAICFCVDRAPGHRFERLAYVLEQARDHQAEMSSFSRSDLKAILRHTLRRLERSRELGWQIPPPEGKEDDQ